jgi:hypothetical protein
MTNWCLSYDISILNFSNIFKIYEHTCKFILEGLCSSYKLALIWFDPNICINMIALSYMYCIDIDLIIDCVYLIYLNMIACITRVEVKSSWEFFLRIHINKHRY